MDILQIRPNNDNFVNTYKSRKSPNTVRLACLSRPKKGGYFPSTPNLSGIALRRGDLIRTVLERLREYNIIFLPEMVLIGGAGGNKKAYHQRYCAMYLKFSSSLEFINLNKNNI
ncbi:hypothetical protein [Scytonema sp. PRP1]|uniref:hypothetical protein n=1 Tax=Scytonema sp. PRP1 TaxID=3120513 RepID=UPI00300CFC9E